MYVCVCVRACVRVCVCVRVYVHVCVCVWIVLSSRLESKTITKLHQECKEVSYGLYKHKEQQIRTGYVRFENVIVYKTEPKKRVDKIRNK